MRKILVLLTALLIVLPFSSLVLAAEEGAMTIQTGGAFKNAPYFTIVGKPGETHTIKVELRNASDNYRATAELLTSDAIPAVGGGMAVITPKDVKQNDVGGWFNDIDKEITLQPKQAKELPLTFTIPKDTKPGEHIGTVTLYKLVIEDEPEELPDGQSKVTINKALSQSIGVLVKVPGKVTHELEIKNEVTQNWNGEDLFISMETINKGSVIEKPIGTIRILNRDTKVLVEENLTMDSFYPGSTTSFSYLTPLKIKQIGDYKVELVWEYAGKKTKRTSDLTIAGKDVKQAKKVEEANKQKENADGLFVLTMKEIISSLVVVLALVAISVVIAVKVTNKKKKK